MLSTSAAIARSSAGSVSAMGPLHLTVGDGPYLLLEVIHGVPETAPDDRGSEHRDERGEHHTGDGDPVRPRLHRGRRRQLGGLPVGQVAAQRLRRRPEPVEEVRARERGSLGVGRHPGAARVDLRLRGLRPPRVGGRRRRVQGGAAGRVVDEQRGQRRLGGRGTDEAVAIRLEEARITGERVPPAAGLLVDQGGHQRVGRSSGGLHTRRHLSHGRTHGESREQPDRPEDHGQRHRDEDQQAHRSTEGHCASLAIHPMRRQGPPPRETGPSVLPATASGGAGSVRLRAR